MKMTFLANYPLSTRPYNLKIIEELKLKFMFYLVNSS